MLFFKKNTFTNSEKASGCLRACVLGHAGVWECERGGMSVRMCRQVFLVNYKKVLNKILFSFDFEVFGFGFFFHFKLLVFCFFSCLVFLSFSSFKF